MNDSSLPNNTTSDFEAPIEQPRLYQLFLKPEFAIEIKNLGAKAKFSWHLKEELRDQGVYIRGFLYHAPHEYPWCDLGRALFFANDDGFVIEDLDRVENQWCTVNLHADRKGPVSLFADRRPPCLQFQVLPDDGSLAESLHPHSKNKLRNREIIAAQIAALNEVDALEQWQATEKKIRSHRAFKKLNDDEKGDLLLLLKEKFFARCDPESPVEDDSRRIRS